MRDEMIFAGFGGQGIMLMGKALSYAAMTEDKFVTWMPSYGAEVRGGTAHSMVIISDHSIASPVVKEPSICIVMNKPSFEKFETKLKQKGMFVINTSLVDNEVTRNDINILKIPATDIAFSLGNVRVSNMVILGALLAKKNIVSLQSLVDSLECVIPENRKNLINVNKEALQEGYEYDTR